ncbi:MAG: DUF4065 domain-containing protein [Nitrosopumilus sp. D6]|nr:MAG: DUF4065 domain-containing protein [Nitrosopumilus sp. D6]
MNGAIWAADYIVALGNGVFTPMHVLKLTYISHGYVLAIRNEPLFNDRIEAWKYGPVIPSLYNTLKEYGDGSVLKLHTCGTPLGSKEFLTRVDAIKKKIGETKCKIIERVAKTYGVYSAMQLSSITHCNGTPWHNTYDGSGYAEIPNEIIKSHYKEILVKNTK